MNLEVINLIILIFFTFFLGFIIFPIEISEPGLKGMDKLIYVKKMVTKNK